MVGSESVSTMPSWVAVIAKPLKEQAAAKWAQFFGYETYLPVFQEKKKVKPLFPRYFFAKLIDGQWSSLKAAPNVCGIVTNGEGYPATINDRLISALQKRENQHGIITLPKREWFQKGQILRIKDPWHILAGKDLVFAGMAGKDRVKVMLSWFGKPQAVALDARNLVVQ